jgi:hypothetical protein
VIDPAFLLAAVAGAVVVGAAVARVAKAKAEAIAVDDSHGNAGDWTLPGER